MAQVRRPTEARRTELVDAALHIIGTRGIAALTTRALAEEVGLTTGALFRHFPSLDALLDAVVTRVEDVLNATYPPAALPPLERLASFVDARSAAVGAQLGIVRLVLSDQFLLALPREGSARLARCVARTRMFVRQCLDEAQRDGTVRRDVPADALALIVMGTVQMLAFRPSARRAPSTPSVRDALLRVLAPIRAPIRAPTRATRPSRRAAGRGGSR